MLWQAWPWCFCCCCCFGKMWKISGLWMRKAVECCKQSLSSYFVSRSLKRRQKYWEQCGLWRPSSRGCRGKILELTSDTLMEFWGGKKGAAFKPCPKPLPEVKLKRNRLISLAVKISRQPNTDCHLVISNHSDADLQSNRASKANGNIKSTTWRKKKYTRKFSVEPRLVLKKIRQWSTGIKGGTLR